MKPCRNRFVQRLKRALGVLAAASLPVIACGQTSAADASGVAVTPLPDGLQGNGMPPIPAEIAERVSHYAGFRPTVLTDWHPVRHEALILAQSAETAQVYRLDSAGGRPTQVTTSSERVGDAIWPRHSDDYFLLVSDRGGDEKWQIYRKDLDGGKVTLLTDGGDSQNMLGVWSHGDDRLAFSSTRRNRVDRDIYVMDPRNPESTRLVMQVTGAGWNPLGWSPDDERLVILQYVSAVESYIWTVDVETGLRAAVTPLPAAAAPLSGTTGWSSQPGSTWSSATARQIEADQSRVRVSYAGAQWSSDGEGIYTATDRDSEFKRLAYIDVSSGRHSYLSSHLRWDVESFAVSDDGERVAFTTNEHGVSVLRMLDTRSGEELPRPDLQVMGVINDLTWHPDGKLLGFTASASSTPSDVFSLDIESGRLERWTRARAGVDTDAFPDPEFVSWKSFDGVEIPALLYRPPARFEGKRPVLALIHGGPEGQARPSFLGSGNYFLLDMGVALLLPNVRGSTGFGNVFVTLDDGKKRENAVRDLGAMLNWIDTDQRLDDSRVMLSGGSYGGYLSLAAAARFNDRIRCAMSIAGISDFVTFLNSTGDYRRDFRRMEYGDERDRRARRYLRKISPLSNAADIQSPLFVVHGRNDPRVPYTEAEQIVETVRKNSVPVWYLLADDEGHGFAKKPNQDYQLYATIAFMQAYLLN